MICADYHYFQIIVGNKFADTAFIDKLNCRDVENLLKFYQTLYHLCFSTVPISFIISYFFTFYTNRQYPLESFNVLQSLLQFRGNLVFFIILHLNYLSLNCCRIESLCLFYLLFSLLNYEEPGVQLRLNRNWCGRFS